MHKNVILVGTSGKPSIRALHPHFDNVTVIEKKESVKGGLFRVHDDPKNFTSFETFKIKGVKKYNLLIKNSIVVRWGNHIPISLFNCVVYNKADAVAKASNKRMTREILSKKNISVPKLVTPLNFEEGDLPIIGRPSHHSKCKNLIKFTTKDAFVTHYENNEHKGWYYSKFINKQRELRIHCAHGKVLSISEKPMPKDQTPDNIIIGWGYSVVEEEWRVLHWSEYRARWCKLALDAVAALGLDFGAVDIIIKDNIIYVLEVNTAGALSESPYLQKRYSMYFKWLFESSSRRDHWEYNKFENGKSFAWKNKQLSI